MATLITCCWCKGYFKKGLCKRKKDSSNEDVEQPNEAIAKLTQEKKDLEKQLEQHTIDQLTKEKEELKIKLENRIAAIKETKDSEEKEVEASSRVSEEASKSVATLQEAENENLKDAPVTAIYMNVPLRHMKPMPLPPLPTDVAPPLPPKDGRIMALTAPAPTTAALTAPVPTAPAPTVPTDELFPPPTYTPPQAPGYSELAEVVRMLSNKVNDFDTEKDTITSLIEEKNEIKKQKDLLEQALAAKEKEGQEDAARIKTNAKINISQVEKEETLFTTSTPNSSVSSGNRSKRRYRIRNQNPQHGVLGSQNIILAQKLEQLEAAALTQRLEHLEASINRQANNEKKKRRK